MDFDTMRKEYEQNCTPYELVFWGDNTPMFELLDEQPASGWFEMVPEFYQSIVNMTNDELKTLLRLHTCMSYT